MAASATLLAKRQMRRPERELLVARLGFGRIRPLRRVPPEQVGRHS